MVIGIFGESCVGKSTLAEKISQNMNVHIYTGKDYLRFAKNEYMARKIFIQKLEEATHSEPIIFVISEKEDLKLLPEGAIRILMKADLDLIKTRFTTRMHGKLPMPVEKMLENKHGCFDEEKYDLCVENQEYEFNSIYDRIMELAHK